MCLNPFVTIIVVCILIILMFGFELSKAVSIARFEQAKRYFNEVSSPETTDGMTSESNTMPTEGMVDVQKKQMHKIAMEEEGFNNDLYDPEVDIDSSDYESALKNMTLEPEIAEQHKKFNAELMTRVGGTSSRNPVRDDNIDVVKWWGLRRPQYKKIDPNDGNARQVPSVISSDDLADYQQISWGLRS